MPAQEARLATAADPALPVAYQAHVWAVHAGEVVQDRGNAKPGLELFCGDRKRSGYWYLFGTIMLHGPPSTAACGYRSA